MSTTLYDHRICKLLSEEKKNKPKTTLEIKARLANSFCSFYIKVESEYFCVRAVFKPLQLRRQLSTLFTFVPKWWTDLKIAGICGLLHTPASVQCVLEEKIIPQTILSRHATKSKMYTDSKGRYCGWMAKQHFELRVHAAIKRKQRIQQHPLPSTPHPSQSSMTRHQLVMGEWCA